MKKYLFFLLTSIAVATTLEAQDVKTEAGKSKKPHLTFSLQQNQFYYSKGSGEEKWKLQVVDSSTIASIIDTAILENKVAKKDLNVHLEGDDLLLHPQFDVLLNTILSKTVSEVRLKTNVFE